MERTAEFILFKKERNGTWGFAMKAISALFPLLWAVGPKDPMGHKRKEWGTSESGFMGLSLHILRQVGQHNPNPCWN